jgi:hypothetical protein
MNEPSKIASATWEPPAGHHSLSRASSYASPSSTDLRVMELEIENSRLQRLVAELLIKNQQLRKEE